MAEIEFVGTPSGDGECFAWALERDAMKEVLTPEEWEEMQKGDQPGVLFYPGSPCLLYATGFLLYSRMNDARDKKFRVKIQIEEVPGGGSEEVSGPRSPG